MLPIHSLQQLYKDTAMYSLRLLGRNTKLLPAALASFLVSFGAAVSEELLFRGFGFIAISMMFNDPIVGLVGSSALFGLAHFYVGDIFLEFLLGLVFGWSYIQSGYNLAVPILVHGFYDFGTMLITWILTTTDLRNRMKMIIEMKIKLLAGDLTAKNEFDLAIFKYLDTNEDGLIDKQEMEFGIQLLGIADFIDEKWPRRMFQIMDSNGNGLIDIKEFSKYTTECLSRVKI